ncbi:MAG: alpha/beta hydrolase [Chloroflexota bacterium]|nr:alpha/beta hydrolase [Chloroflexota bacterium]
MPKRLPRSRTLKGDPKIAYYDSGGGVAGEAPVLLLHGATLRSEDWENVFPRLATRYRVVAYDARGHGKSGRAAGYALDDLVGDALRVLREVVRAPAIVIGHSLGGATALVVAARDPALVRGLVLVDPWLSLYRDTQWHREAFTRLRAALERREDPAAFARAVGGLPLAERGPRGERTVGEVRGFYSAERLAMYYRDVDPAFVDQILTPDPAGAAEIAAAPAAVRAPTLVLAAGTDSALASGEAERVAAPLPDAKVVRFPGVGHRIHGLRPEPFLEAIEPFLRRVRSA